MFYLSRKLMMSTSDSEAALLLSLGTVLLAVALVVSAYHCCGCGNEVVTPLSPTDWRLLYDGEGISLEPSIGNWSFHCRSHYWVRKNRVVWAPGWSRAQIDGGRASDRIAKSERFQNATKESTRGRFSWAAVLNKARSVLKRISRGQHQ
jgi:hypothetical protein